MDKKTIAYVLVAAMLAVAASGVYIAASGAYRSQLLPMAPYRASDANSLQTANSTTGTTASSTTISNAGMQAHEGGADSMIYITGASAYVGPNSGHENTTLLGVSVSNNASVPIAVKTVTFKGENGSSITFMINPSNSSMQLPTQLNSSSGFVLAPHQNTTFVYDNYSSSMLAANRTYSVSVAGSNGSYATYANLTAIKSG
ncbi:MAG: hypothetical protein KGI06_02500 [Candidatus Micrarchaeota archaeon]|nr:hypothetical protein [Candidatus Micrarchaeota archaeon]